MINSHYSVARWGTAQMWWTGTFEELKSFKEWIEQHVPKNQFSWFATKWPKDEFAKNHLSGWFKTNAWTFLVYWWADGKLGPRNPDGSLLKWEAVNGTPQYGAVHQPEPSLDFIDTLRRDACDKLGERVLARMRQIRIEDPVVYGISCTQDDETRYLTCNPGWGTNQLWATNLQHHHLWLCSCRKHAETHRRCFEEEGIESGEFWQCYEIPKSAAVKLPCYQRGPKHERYLDNEEMVFEGGYDHRRDL